MPRTRRLVAATAAAAIGLGALAACGTEPVYQDPVVARPQPNSLAAPPLADAINATGYEVFHVIANGSDGDVVISPLSIGVAFGMLDAGATGAVSDALNGLFAFPGTGETRWEGFNALTQGVETEPTPAREKLSPDDWHPQPPVVRIANRMFQDDGFTPEPDYPVTLGKWWGAGIEPLAIRSDPNGARKRINGWVSDRTEHLIPELLGKDAVQPDTALILVNAIYMNADWASPFSADDTSDKDFFRLDGSSVSVPMMYNGELTVEATVGDGYVAARLPYADSDLSMLLIVPDSGGYGAIESGFDAEWVAGVDAALATTDVELYLPSFASETHADLRDIFENDLGIAGLFDTEDLLGIGPNLVVSSAVHGAKIKVDERGTEAAAATAITVGLTAMPLPPALEVRADRPFLYVVRDESTGAVLFVGRVLDPS